MDDGYPSGEDRLPDFAGLGNNDAISDGGMTDGKDSGQAVQA